MEQYKNPPIPQGFVRLDGTWDTGFVIQNLRDQSEFVWIPVGALPQNGKMYETAEPVSFGRRDYGSRTMYLQSMTDELKNQVESVRKYGGFYISRYDISGAEHGTPKSVANAEPWTRVNLTEAQRVAASYIQNGSVSAHLPYAAEIDSMLCWLIESGVFTEENASEYVSDAKIIRADRRKEMTGKTEAKKEIYDISRNIDAWVQESRDAALFRCSVCVFPQTSHCYFRPYSCYTFAGFRIVLTVS